MKKRFTNIHQYLNNHKILKYPYSFLVIAVGLLFIIAGILMLVLPGPGIITILLGTAILSTQFTWARTFLNYSLTHLKNLKIRIQQYLKKDSEKQCQE